MIALTSKDNAKIKEIVHLRKSGQRKKNKQFLIEGEKEILMALNADVPISDLFFSSLVTKEKFNIFPKNINCYSVEEKLFNKISLRENPDGHLAIAELQNKSLSEIKLSSCPLVLVLETVEKPGNLGAILRSADAAGIDAVILMDQKTDIFNPNVIRSSLGAVFTCQIATCEQKEFFGWLNKNNITAFAATPDTDEYYTDVNFKMPSAIIIGTEHEGLSERTLALSDKKIKIPMSGKIDSLNASVSAALLIFEAIRQRKK